MIQHNCIGDVGYRSYIRFLVLRFASKEFFTSAPPPITTSAIASPPVATPASAPPPATTSSGASPPVATSASAVARREGSLRLAVGRAVLAAKVDLYNRNGGCSITVHTFRSSSTRWDRATSTGHRRLPFGKLEDRRDAVVLGGNTVHWLLQDVNKILTYDIRREWLGSVKLPPTSGVKSSQRILGTSTDGRLRLLTAERFVISAWLQVEDGWVKEAVIDVEQNLRSLLPSMSPDCMWIAFERFGERSRVVLFRVYHGDDMLLRPKGRLAVLDLDTREMHMQEAYPSSLLVDIDLSQHLQQGMKIFS
ncbi:uncharacterized protein [Lolium perenne]|uniref:uncharacterized protein n=1 Tax=Lolium perenne TaxID=4522 RepID=UPI0021F680A0|nr:uncharacterized protein LOC127340518 [Lolium perenne]